MTMTENDAVAPTPSGSARPSASLSPATTAEAKTAAFLASITESNGAPLAVASASSVQVDLSGLQCERDRLQPRDGETPAWWDDGVRGVRLEGADLSGSILSSALLVGANLRNATLTDVVARSADFTEAILEEARFERSDLGGSNFTEAQAGEADFSQAMLEDASFVRASLRYANLRGALLDGADFTEADLWGANLQDIEADDAVFRRAHCDEADLGGGDLSGADFAGASLKKARFPKAKLRGVKFDGANLDGAHFDEADLSNASLPRTSLLTCSLRHVRLAGAWLDNTRVRVDQLGGAVGEELAGEYDAAREAYVVLEQNFRGLGNGDDASWAFRKGRRMRKLHALAAARRARHAGMWRTAVAETLSWASDCFVEWLCDYGESLWRVLRAFLVTILSFAAFYGATGSLTRLADTAAGPAKVVTRNPADLLVYSFLNMLSTSAPDVGLHPIGPMFYLLTSLQGAVGIVLIGLFGYVLGNRMHR